MDRSFAELTAAIEARQPTLPEIRERAIAAQLKFNAFITLPEPLSCMPENEKYIPVAVKDCIKVTGIPTTYGSKIFANSEPEKTDAAVIKLLRRAGGTVAGKTHLSEFCFGATGQNQHFGNACNPWDSNRITGGSSSGSGAAVAAGIVRLALGTDTGGSVRIPAGLCGVVGLRPTVGRVSNQGCLSVSTICDTIGPIAASVSEAAWLYDVIQGYDPADPLSIAKGISSASCLRDGVSGLTIGIARPFYFEDSDADVIEGVEHAIAVLEKLGVAVRDVALGDVQERREQHAIRFVAADVAEARTEIYESNYHDLGKEFRRRIESGQQLTGMEYAASIRASLRFRQSLREHFESGIDVLITPTCPATAPLWEDASDMITTTGKMARFTYDFAAAGVPALTVPCGFDKQGLPIGMQLIGSWGNDALLFQTAFAFEQATSFHTNRPILVYG